MFPWNVHVWGKEEGGSTDSVVLPFKEGRGCDGQLKAIR